MGKINNWITDKLRNWLDVPENIRGDIPMNDNNQIQDDKLKYRLAEYSAWYSGQEDSIEDFYKGNIRYLDYSKYSNYRETLFWKRANNKIRKLHTGLPQQISEIMANIVFSPGYDIVVNVLNEQGEVIEDESDKAQKTLKAILKDNSEKILFNEAAETESWGGFTDFKLSIDTDVSQYPLIEVIQPDTFNIDTYRNRIVAHNFEFVIIRGRETFVRVEKYGRGYVENTLYKVNNKGVRSEVPLDSIPETAHLIPYIELSGFDDIAAVYKPNKLPNNEFRGSMIGESDYAGVEGQFDALDEITSTMIDTIRKTRLKRFISDEVLPRDYNGNTLPLDDFDMDYVEITGAPGEGEKSKDAVTTSVSKLETKELINSYNNTYRNILRNIGISPATIETDNIGANASGDSIREREKATDATSRRKQETWEDTLSELAVKSLQLNDIINENKPRDYQVIVTFNRYIDEFGSRIKTAAEAVEGKVLSIKRALKMVFENKLTEEELEELVQDIYVEQGILVNVADENDDNEE